MISVSNYSAIDRHFASMLSRKVGEADTDLVKIFMALSSQLRQQHTCLEINDQTTLTNLRDCAAVSEIALSDSLRDESDLVIRAPLVLLNVNDSLGFLYTQRFFAYETRIANSLIARNKSVGDADSNVAALKTFLQAGDHPLQILAATQAVTRRLSMVTGGPGTGKTSTVVKILSALLKAKPNLRIRLAAPTGKAAMRLSESIRSAADRLNTKVPAEVSTIHRLLGMRGDGNSFTYYAKRRLPLDVVILDEASMIDLVMFDRFLAALEPETHIILLGDPKQLPSVDSGSVLSDITAHGSVVSEDYLEHLKRWTDQDVDVKTSLHPLANSHAMLKTSFRFGADSGIGKLSQWLQSDNGDLSWAESEGVTVSRQFTQTDVLHTMSDAYGDYLTACRNSDAEADELLDLFDRARLLTPVREGEFGVTQLNQSFEQRHFPDLDNYYHGKPVMIERNHYSLRLFNGDIGICVQRGDKIEVAFRKASGELEYYLPSRLPQHDTCFAMTVHKSQGSEFDEVLLVLPEVQQENFLNKELVYTGVTRCREKLFIFTHTDLHALPQNTRVSALGRRLAAFTDSERAANKSKRSTKAAKTSSADSGSQMDLF
jgi:exodeoxyribonuclease V alpha subunit